MAHPFNSTGKKIHIVTIHGKEKVIGPLLEERLQVRAGVIRSLNTDEFGTFSGEIERSDPPVVTLRKKIIAAHQLTGHSVIVGSEGSFGSHPAFFMLAADEEWVMLKDFDNDIEIIGRYLTEETNFSGETIASLEQFRRFCDHVRYPSHGLILKLGDDQQEMYKDLPPESLEEMISSALENNVTVYIETDMRADRNPTRMHAIGHATVNLLERIASTCPECAMPGFWIKEVVPGLPCRVCNSPTKSIKSYIYRCDHCNYAENRANEKKSKEEPMYCDFCNP